MNEPPALAVGRCRGAPKACVRAEGGQRPGLSGGLATEVSPALCHPVDCSPCQATLSVYSPGKKSAVACHALLQGIFPTQGSNPGRFFTD